MKLTGKEANAIVYNLHKEWELEKKRVIYDKDRWNGFFRSIHKHLETGKHYQFSYVEGLTEAQPLEAFEYDKEYSPIEVELREVQCMDWFPVNVNITRQKLTHS